MKKYIFLFILTTIILAKNSICSNQAPLILTQKSNVNAMIASVPNQNGILDQTFGNNNTGVPGITYLTNYIVPFGYQNFPSEIIIDSFKNIICAGISTENKFNKNFFSIARFTPSGLVDSGFGNNGTNYVNFPIGGEDQNDHCFACVNDKNGYILGGVVNCGFRTYGIAKFTQQGFLDLSFGENENGTNFIPTQITGTGAGHNYLSTMITNQITEKIITAGFSTNGPNSYFSLAQFLPSGILDTFFGENGTGYTYLPINIAGGSEDYCYAVGLQSTGNIILAGSSNNTANESRFAVACYTTNGILNTSFGNNGTAYISYAIAGGNFDACYALAIQPDDKIILAGTSDTKNNLSLFSFARFTANGKLDKTFGTNGTTYIQAINDGILHYCSTVQLQSDGKIVAAGINNFRCVFIRLNNNGSIDTTFGNNGIYSLNFTNLLFANSLTLTNNTIVACGPWLGHFSVCKLSNIPTMKQFQSIYAGKAGLAA